MKGKYDISTTERDVFEKLWEYPEGINQTKLLEIFNLEGREWKRQTLNTYLAALEEKNLIKRVKRVVYPLYTEEAYNNLLMRDAIDKMYHGKVSNFFVALAKEENISEDEVEHLLDVLNKYKNEGEI